MYKARVAECLKNAPVFVRNVMVPIAAGQGNTLEVSKFTQNGEMITGTTRYAKRGIAVTIPVWQADTCIQCTNCAVACPHAVIRPYLANEDEISNSPIKFLEAKNALAKKHAKYFAIQPSPFDCTGCGVCVASCPTAQKGTLVMTKFEEVIEKEQEKQLFLDDNVSYKCRDFTLSECET